MMPRDVKKVLIANRGEIAVRVARGMRELGILSVAIYSDADRHALHVREADEAVAIGGVSPRESYLDIAKVIDAVRRSGADAVHPGYGFLSENAAFAKACEETGITFIGPRSETIELLGNKVRAREIAVQHQVPILPGTGKPLAGLDEARSQAEHIGYPVLLKAAAGGGGKGMRVVEGPELLAEALQRASSEAQSAFGDPAVYMEKYLAEPRHIEVQIFGDEHGNVMHLGERECSIQRRHQKLVEESPSPAIDDRQRHELGECAVRLARACQYRGAGTVEFLLDSTGKFYFLEVNTRLQVEHPVTEMVTSLDLVHLQVAVARGEKLPFVQSDIRHRGAAIEVRLYAEDPANGFVPSPGKIHRLERRPAPGIREDSGVIEGTVVSPNYDPLVSKIIAYGPDRKTAIARLLAYIESYTLLGIQTTLPFFRRLLRHPRFVEGRMSTRFLQDHADDLKAEPASEEQDLALIAAGLMAARGYQQPDGRAAPPPASSNWKEFGRRQAMSSAFRYRD